MTLTLQANIVPTGGCISLTFVTSPSGTITLSRATSGSGGLSAFTTLYSGAPLNVNLGDQLFLDLGDQLPGNVLLPNTQYVYQLTDSTGTVTTNPLTPVSNLQIDIIDLVPVLISLLQGAINATSFPAGVNTARVLQAMPLTGLAPMPFVVINPDLVQQTDIPIGQAALNLGGQLTQPGQVNIYTQTGFSRNVFRISVFSLNASERDFYRDLIISVFRISLVYVFQNLGLDVEHHYQASSYQTTEVGQGMVPGFYGCDILLEVHGTSNVTIHTTYGVIEFIDTYVFGASGSTSTVIVSGFA